jgi:RNA polymerase sigma-54 factor
MFFNAFQEFEMPVSVKLGLKQTQRLALTQSLKQSIELLQLSTLELAERITRELEENPILEEDNISTHPSISEDESEFISSISRNLSGGDQYAPGEDTYYNMSDAPESGYTPSWDDDRKRNLIENAVAQEETLKEHLLWQARIAANTPAETALLETIITSIDDNGFLTADPADIALELSVDRSEVERAIAQISVFDPIGCGVSGARESLLVQAEYFFPGDETLKSILTGHFSDLEKLNYDRIARALNLSLDEVILKSRAIQRLDPFPGRQYAPRDIRFVTPDIEVKQLDGELIIYLNDDWVPSIRINSYYINLLRQKSIEKNIREYIQDRVYSARYLIRNITSRRETILRVVRAIMERQMEFLVKGPGHLKPLVHTDIAQELGLHESTISRVTSNKFVQTGWGVFELKYFFVSRLKSGTDEERSSDEVMNLIKDIVSGEDPEKPFTDDDIAMMLEKSGIIVARRTIAKYRGMLSIPPSNKRKKLNKLKAKRSL